MNYFGLNINLFILKFKINQFLTKLLNTPNLLKNRFPLKEQIAQLTYLNSQLVL